MAARLGILGGTFDPIHCGHLDAGAAAEQALGLTGVCVMTSHIPPHRPQPLTSGYHRYAMAAIAVAGRKGWWASDLELRFGTPSYTSGTLKRLHERGYAPAELYFVIGADAFADIQSWRDYPKLLDAANFAVVSRPGLHVNALAGKLPPLADRMARPGDDVSRRETWIFLIDAPTADVSSTAIRERLAGGGSIAGMVPAGVRQHIEQHGLYLSTPRDTRAIDTP